MNAMSSRSWVCRLVLAGVAIALVAAACTGGGPKPRGRSPQTTEPGPGPSIAPGAEAPRIVGWLHTKGMQLLDSRDDTVRLLGVHYHNMAPGTGAPSSQFKKNCFGWTAPDQTVVDDIASWGFNSVRMAISWANLEPSPPTAGPNGSLVHTYNQPYLAALDQAIELFKAKGIAVILSMQQNKWTPAFIRSKKGVQGSCPGQGMPAWLYQGNGITNYQQAKASFFHDVGNQRAMLAEAWKVVAKRYADDSTVVGADMINEPYPTGGLTPQDLQLHALYQTLGSAIRSVNSHILLIFEDSSDQLDGQFGLTGPPHFDNVVYSFHLYRPNWDPIGKQVMEDYVTRARTWDVPVWIGEFNMFGGSNNGKPAHPGWEESTRAMLAYCKANGISWDEHGYTGQSSLIQMESGQPKTQLIQILQSGF